MSTPVALKQLVHRYDVVVCGGGLAGIGAAITAARHGGHVALIQDRSVLGGNASKEIRVWAHGASGGANCLWFRETGLMEELLLENQYRNPTGNAEVWDALLLDKVRAQERLDLFLNTMVYEVRTNPKRNRIECVAALTLQAETLHLFEAGYYIDCTGDGTVGYLAGAPYMTGREAQETFGEALAPTISQTYTLGGSILFKAKNAGKPVPFIAPSFAHKFTAKDFRNGKNPIPEFDHLNGGFWWIEWGGTLDTIHDNEAIKYELLKIAYGIFDYLKNDPRLCEKYMNFELEWVGTIPGKRESRRFIGDYILKEQDITGQTYFSDAIAYGGWNLDDHARLGFFDEVEPPSTHTQIPGLYNIPLRCLYSQTVENLLFAGRNISATHIALTSTRVMLTCAQLGEAAGAAAAMAHNRNLKLRELVAEPHIVALQEKLLLDDHYIVGLRSRDNSDILLNLQPLPQDVTAYSLGNNINAVSVSSSSQLQRIAFERPDSAVPLNCDRMALFAHADTHLPMVEILLSVSADTSLHWQVHQADTRGNCIPHVTCGEGAIELRKGERQWVSIPLQVEGLVPGWTMIELKKNAAVHWHQMHERLPGYRSYQEQTHKSSNWINRWSRFGRIMPGHSRPLTEKNYCLRLPEQPALFAPQNVCNGYTRPFRLPNCWISAPTDFAQPERLTFSFAQPQWIARLQLLLDSDLERHLPSMWVEVPYRIEPDLLKDFDLEIEVYGQWQTLYSIRGNRQRRCTYVLEKPLLAEKLQLTIFATNGTNRAQIYAVRAWGTQ